MSYNNFALLVSASSLPKFFIRTYIFSAFSSKSRRTAHQGRLQLQRFLVHKINGAENLSKYFPVKLQTHSKISFSQIMFCSRNICFQIRKKLYITHTQPYHTLNKYFISRITIRSQKIWPSNILLRLEWLFFLVIITLPIAMIIIDLDFEFYS